MTEHNYLACNSQRDIWETKNTEKVSFLLFSKCLCQFVDRLYVLVKFSSDEVLSIRKLFLTSCLFVCFDMQCYLRLFGIAVVFSKAPCWCGMMLFKMLLFNQQLSVMHLDIMSYLLLPQKNCLLWFWDTFPWASIL